MLSVTSLITYLYCERKLYLQKVLGLKEPLKPALVKGTIRHKAYESIFSSEEKIISSIKGSMSLEEVKEIYREECRLSLNKAILENKPNLDMFNLDAAALFKQVLPRVLSEFDVRAEYVYRFMETHGIHGKELWEKLEPKIEAELKISSESLNLSGIIDHIEIYKKGFVPVELKTGKSPRDGVWPGHRVQLVAYSLLLEEKFSTEIKEGFVKYVDSGEIRHISLNPFMRLEVRELAEKVSRMFHSTILPDFSSNKNKCLACSFKDDCFNEQKISGLHLRAIKATTEK